MKYVVTIRNRKDPNDPALNFWRFNDLNRVALIKAIRTATGLGLKEAKDLSDDLHSDRSIVLDVIAKYGTVEEVLAGLREQGLDAERALDDPITLLRTAADIALDIDDVALAVDILTVVRNYTS